MSTGSTSTRKHDTPPQEPAYPDSAQLAALGNVPGDYRHHPKQVSPASGLALPGGFLKWYDIHDPDAAIGPITRDQARDFLRGEAAAGRLDLRDELGFALLHRCSGDVYFLVACTWRHHNELWQTVYERDADGAFTPHPRGGGHAATQCVWELTATGHERQAWKRYLDSRRDEPAKRSYLADVFAGLA
jgi:hypothetical protein